MMKNFLDGKFEIQMKMGENKQYMEAEHTREQRRLRKRRGKGIRRWHVAKR